MSTKDFDAIFAAAFIAARAVVKAASADRPDNGTPGWAGVAIPTADEGLSRWLDQCPCALRMPDAFWVGDPGQYAGQRGDIPYRGADVFAAVLTAFGIACRVETGAD